VNDESSRLEASMFRVTKSSWDTAAEEDTLPTVPAARLVGHKGSIQAIQFTGEIVMFCLRTKNIKISDGIL
jgi:hypothetical protein